MSRALFCFLICLLNVFSGIGTLLADADSQSASTNSGTATTAALPLPPEGEVYIPPQSGVVNVKDAPFGAKGDGTTDDTNAIQKALSSTVSTHGVVFLPNGTYLVSDTLKWNSGNPNASVGGWGPFLQLQGESRKGTIIKLKSNCEGFGDPQSPRAVIMTGSSGSDGHKDYHNGEGNEAFENNLRDFTVDVGSGNSGAIGIDYQVSNCGAMRRVSILSSDPNKAGYSGISMERRDDGPGLIKEVSVDGFSYGARISGDVAQMVMENVTFSDQKVVVLFQRDATLVIRKLETRGNVPVLRLSGRGYATLLDSQLNGRKDVQALEVSGTQTQYLMCNIAWKDFGSLRGSLEANLASPIGLLVSNGVMGKDGQPINNASSVLSLPVNDTPEIPQASSDQWAYVGDSNGVDDTEAIQFALNSGKSRIYFSHHEYFYTKTLSVPPSVKVITSFGGSLTARGDVGKNRTPMFETKGGAAHDPLLLDRFTWGCDSGFLLHHDSPRDVIMQDIITFGGKVYRGEEGCGDVYIEDVAGSGYEFAKGNKAWARQFDIEGNGDFRVTNSGGQLWALGFKFEGGGTTVVARNSNNGKMELLGGLLYTFGVDSKTCAICNQDSSLLTGFVGITFVHPNGFYKNLVGTGTESLLQADSVPVRGGGVTVPAFSVDN